MHSVLGFALDQLAGAYAPVDERGARAARAGTTASGAAVGVFGRPAISGLRPG